MLDRPPRFEKVFSSRYLRGRAWSTGWYWYERYGRRIEDARLPETQSKREAYASQVGHDGFVLLAALDKPNAPQEFAALPAIDVLRCVWACHFEPVDGGIKRPAVQPCGVGHA